MYDVAQYRDMILDGARTTAYVRALRKAVAPGAVVTEIGTGVGYFAVQACLAGAARVYAIEPNPAIRIAREVADANGCTDRIRFIQDLSSRVTVEPADVLISDLRGAMPQFGDHLPSIVDARTRLVKPGGALIPRRDVLYAALTAADGPTAPPTGPDVPPVDLTPVTRITANKLHFTEVKADRLMSRPEAWLTLDYRTLVSPNADGGVTLVADRTTTADGVCVWFETDLHDDCGYSAGPGAASTIYGQLLFPILPAVPLDRGDAVELRFRATLAGGDYVWRWSGRIASGSHRGTEFSRSTLHSLALDPRSLRKRGDRFVPHLGPKGQAEAWMLARMGAGTGTLRDVAAGALEEFPDVFANFEQALTRAADLSERLSE